MSKANTAQTKSNRVSPGRFNFMSVSNYFAVVSTILVVVALVDIFAQGFNYGIDFAGGTEIQVQFGQPIEQSRVVQFTQDQGYSNATVQSFEESREYLIRLESIQGATDQETNQLMNSMLEKLTSGLAGSFADESAVVRRVDSVGPQIGSELKRNGVLALFYSLLMILIYVALRFDYKFAPAAVFCLFHDAIVTMGIFAVFQREVNVQTMAAIMTLIGYSLNDTIIIFDRVRENLKIYRDQNLTWVINRSINDTLSRTLLTSFTTLLAVGAMYFFADGVIRDFAFTLGIGMVLGTYSTIYVASPLVLLFDKFQGKAV